MRCFLLATRLRVARTEEGAGVAAQRPRQHPLFFEQGAALQV